MTTSRPARFAAGAFLAAALAMSAASVSAQEQSTTVLSVDQARQLGFALVEQRNIPAAVAIARAILQNDPQDAGAWILLARALRVAGDLEGARDAAGRANSVATTDDARYAASMELAAANFRLERQLIAQFWLRRAAQIAPTEALKAEAIRNFREVQARNPWQISFQFSVLPSSNVNNGSRESVIEIAGLPFTLSGDAQALSGLELSAGVTARYRFRGVADRPAQLSFGAAVQRVRLSDEARDQAPDAEASDYAYDALEFGYGQILNDTGSRVIWRFDGAIGRNWYGGDPLSNYARAGVSAQWESGASAVTAAGASLERQVRLDQEARSAWVARADLRQTWRLASGDTLSVAGGLRRTRSDSVEIDHLATSASVSYRFGKPVFGGVTLEGALGYEHRSYDQSPYSADGRTDDRYRVTATLGFPDYNYFGFAPTLTLEGQRTDSNVSLYRSEDYGIRLGIQSVF